MKKIDRLKNTVLYLASKGDGFQWNPYSDSVLNRTASKMIKDGILFKEMKCKSNCIFLKPTKNYFKATRAS